MFAFAAEQPVDICAQPFVAESVYYEVLTSAKLPFDEAEKRCESLGGTLPQLSSETRIEKCTEAVDSALGKNSGVE